MVTDGESTNPAAQTQQAAQTQKSKGVMMIAIGVGQSANQQELEGIASEPKADHWTLLDDFQSLPALAQLLARSCIPRIPDGATITWGVQKKRIAAMVLLFAFFAHGYWVNGFAWDFALHKLQL